MFYYRHQAGGTLFAHPFVEMPTEAQVQLLREAMAKKHGERHPKTGELYWERIEESTGQLDGDGNAIMRVHGATEAQSGHPGPIELASEAAGERLRGNVTGGGAGVVRNP